MFLRNLRLSISNVGRTSSSKSLPVNSCKILYKKDENGKDTTEIDGYAIMCAVNRGDSLKVKFPPTIEHKFKELQQQISNDFLIEISFQNLKLIPYAMQTPNGILSGVSARADDFDIVSSTANDIDIDDIDITP